jgi:hypothetical protein
VKRLMLVVAAGLLLVAAPSFAQIIDFNGNVVAGVAVDTAKEPVGHRADFMLSLNVTGFRLAENLYFGGIGADAGTVQSVLGAITTYGLSITVPGLTYYPKGGQWLVQTGVSQAILGPEGVDKPFRVYFAGGYGFTSPVRIAAKRKAKAEKERAEMLLRYPPQS